MKKAFVYLRVSSAQQVAGDGFDRQLESCQSFCASREWAIVRVFREQETGAMKYQDREQMLDMLEKCRDGGIDTIVVERPDRIARDLLVQELFLRDCKEFGVEVYPADCGEELVQAKGDPTRILIRQLLGALAEWEKSQIVRKLQHGRRKKAVTTGLPCGGPVPYGHNPDLEVRSREQKVIDIILTETILNHVSHTELARRLTGKYPSPSGNRTWARSSVWSVAKDNHSCVRAGELRKQVFDALIAKYPETVTV